MAERGSSGAPRSGRPLGARQAPSYDLRVELTLTAADDPNLRAWHLSVDGMSADGPNLSHWPGNRTPRHLKADLSTGICLRFARLPAHERAAFLAGATQVLNNHYDTDGFLSLLAVTHPQVALAREELCLLAAATGDYGAFSTARAFAIDRIVLNLGKVAGTPLHGTLADLPQAQRDFVRYRWLLQHAEAVLDHPERFAPLYEAELHATVGALEAAQAGSLRRELYYHEGLAVLTTDSDVPRMVLNTFSVLHRVLHITPSAPAPGGRHAYRLHDRTESWFEMVTIAPAPRFDLRPVAAQLQHLELAAGGPPEGTWNADPPDEPIPELYFGAPAPQAYGEITRTLAPSRLRPLQVIDCVRAHARA